MEPAAAFDRTYTGAWTLATDQPPPGMPSENCVWSHGGWLCGGGPPPSQDSPQIETGDSVPGSLEITCPASGNCVASMSAGGELLWEGSLKIVSDGELRHQGEVGVAACEGQTHQVTAAISYSDGAATAHYAILSTPDTCAAADGTVYMADQSWSFEGTAD